MQPGLCVKCKGVKALCGKTQCPKLERVRAVQKLSDSVGKEMSGASPTIFVGKMGYPRVFAGPMITPFEREKDLDTPENWFGKSLENISMMRSSLVRSKEPLHVSALNPSRDLINMQDIAMSSKYVDTEAEFTRKPSVQNVSVDSVSAPYGPTAELMKFSLSENPSIDRKIDYIVSDDLKSQDQMTSMFEKNAPVSQISRILSVGLLGFDKKLVPTRWSITATDDTLGKNLVKEVKDFRENDEYQLFYSEYLGNKFWIMLFPGSWCFENLEVYEPGNIWMEKDEPLQFMKDWEPYEGRKKYADQVTGAYYAARLRVLQKLCDLKRQASVIVLRVITPEYLIPLGVWVIRETVEDAMKSRPETFQSLNDMLEYVQARSKVPWEKESELLTLFRSRDIMRQYFGLGKS